MKQLVILVILSLLFSCGSNTTSPVISGNGSSTSSSSTGEISSRNSSSLSSSSRLDGISSSNDIPSSASINGPILDTAWGSVKFDGQNYKTISINGKTWFAENLNVGTMVLGMGSLSNQDDDNMVEKFCYGDNEGMCDSFGGLYQWAEAMALPSECNQLDCSSSIQVLHRGICPEQWHIPSSAEYDSLIETLGGKSIAGFYAKGKSEYTTWDQAMNSLGYSGFDIIPSGMRNDVGSYANSGLEAHFWSSKEMFSDDAYEYYAWNSSETFISQGRDKHSAYSIRCVKNGTR